MLLSRPAQTLVAGALGLALVLSGASSASAAPGKAPAKAASKAVVAKADKRVVALHTVVLRDLARVEAGLAKAVREGRGLTPTHATALAAARTAVTKDLDALRAEADAAKTVDQLTALRRRVPAAAPTVLASTAKVVARADTAAAAAVAADEALEDAVKTAGSAGELADEVDAARAAATKAAQALAPAADRLITGLATPSGRAAAARAQARVAALVGALKARTGDLRELAEQVSQREPSPQPTTPAPESTPAPAAPTA